jgi:hypothetical protein
MSDIPREVWSPAAERRDASRNANGFSRARIERLYGITLGGPWRGETFSAMRKICRQLARVTSTVVGIGGSGGIAPGDRSGPPTACRPVLER